MATFHVYVEGAVDNTPDGIRRLATAISQRYGLPAADLLTRLGAGRFRVKANVDHPTADAYRAALEDVGARVAIEPADAGRASTPSIPLRGNTQPPPRSQPSVPPATQPAKSSPALAPQARTGAASLPPATQSRTTTGGSLPPRTTTSPVQPRTTTGGTLPAQPRTSTAPSLQSGLAAAFSTRAQSESEFAGLGSAMSLASLDGNADETPITSGFAPPPEPEPVAAPSARAQAKSAPLDLFAPPDAEEAEAKVELAADEIEHRAKKQSTPPATEPVSAPSTPAMRRSQPSIQPPTVAVEESTMPRGKFAAAVLVAVVLGFIPAHLIAASRESSAFRAVDTQVLKTQNDAVEDEDAYNALDGFRSAQLAKKQGEQKSIAWQSMLIWVVISGVAGVVLVRRFAR